MLSRREFVIASVSAAGGLLIAIRLPAATRPRPYESTDGGATEVSAWLAIEPDNTVIIRCAQAEMGEGVLTSLPMLIVEELEADWAQVRIEYASANRNLRENNVYGRMTTVGSHAVRGSRVALQTAGANARERLRAAPASQWNVPVSQTRAELGRIYDTQSNRSATFGELARRAAAITDIPKLDLKRPQHGKLTVEDGVVRETNFDRYPLLRLRDTPTMETYFSLSGGEMWGGIGEAAVGTVAPAVTNAIFSATRKRVRSLPIADHDLSAA